MNAWLPAAGALFTGAAALLGALVAWKRFNSERVVGTVTQWQELYKSMTAELAEKVIRIEKQDDQIQELHDQVDLERRRRLEAEAKSEDCEREKRLMRVQLEKFLERRHK